MAAELSYKAAEPIGGADTEALLRSLRTAANNLAQRLDQDQAAPALRPSPRKRETVSVAPPPAPTPDHDLVADLQAELAVVQAALATEREQGAELRKQLDEVAVLKNLLKAERERAEALRIDRDRWAARAEILALPIFRDRDPAPAAPEPS